ncbi:MULTISPECIES: phosphate acetyltransferase [unclassified Mycoplasma]|uniref:phosphate acetyltransferase n=1 Tax=unclassified Mycoplasma TaxID=2683645 RepID=UPI00211BAD28|nr:MULTISPECIES: phosphate acetyltransferase [unclassified Mycoplasma]UUM19924.1 phosphate acetyltransferase [Mycoplasma sp. 1578d]UUM24905.1 phosphate acetyltransferase [Mycoplasma sp. 3686d]
MNFELALQQKTQNLSSVKTIVLIDGDDPRMVSAARELQKFSNIKTILLVENNQHKVDGLEFINIFQDQEKLELLTNKYLELRKGKETLEQAQKALETRPFYAMMLLALDEAHGVVGGLKYATADILRAAFKAIGPKLGTKTISSAMIMHKDESNFIFSDISVNVKPNAEQLAEIGLNAQEFAQQMGFDSKVAFLSFSTSFSAKTPESELVKEATDLFNQKSNNQAIGEIQLDAAIDLEIRKSKYKDASYSEKANVLIFPDLNAGNIGYKLVQRFAGYGAIGPVVVGTKKPVNDLSRGSTVSDVVNTVLITALQSEGNK